MSAAAGPPGPEIPVTLSLPEWQVLFSALQEAPMPLRVTQGVAIKLQQQIAAHMKAQRANGTLPEAEERP